MAFRITNDSFGRRQAFRPMLGASPSPSTLANVAPDSVPPEKVEQMPVSTDEANKARTTYILSAKALEGWVSTDLEKIKVADWDETIARVVPFIITQYNSLVQQVRGRTGNSEGEYALELRWWGLWDQAYQAWKNRPSSFEQGAAGVARWFSDFAQGAKEAWQGYIDWGIRHSGPILRKYHDSLEHLAKLEANLVEAEASGQVSQGELFDQQVSVQRARESVANVQSLYKTLSGGGDLNAIAVEVFGPITLSGWAIPAAVVPIITTIGVAIVNAAAVVLSIYLIGSFLFSGVEKAGTNFMKMMKDNPVGTTAMLGFVLGMIALPFALFKSKDVVVVPGQEIP